MQLYFKVGIQLLAEWQALSVAVAMAAVYNYCVVVTMAVCVIVFSSLEVDAQQ